jgi:mono/diheme cytochrome c family protein
VPPFVAGFERFARHSEAERVVGGRLLLSELSCTACHRPPDTEPQPKLGLRLDVAGSRLQHDWLRRFIESPQTVKPGTTMPDALGGLKPRERTRAAEALAAFLATRRSPFPEIKATGTSPVPHEFWTKGNPERGNQLYHQIGCVACHEPDAEYDAGARLSALDQMLEQLSPQEIEELSLTAAARPVPSVPHGDLAAKYTLQSLTFFLLDPETVRPGGRMPSLKLSPVEAADIAAFLLRNQPDATVAPVDPRLVETGQRLFHELSCVNCHSIDGARPTRMAKPLRDLNLQAETSCFGVRRQDLPHFALDDLQIQSIRLAHATLDDAHRGENTSPAEEVSFRMLQLNCYACHERDRRGGVGNNRQRYFETARHVDLGDEGRLPPPLTGVGRKLQGAWLTKVLAGTGDVRPYLLARMPKFPKASVASLPGLLAHADGVAPAAEQQVFGDRSGLAEAGRALLDTGCVQCHAVRGERLPGVAGIELAGIADRIQPQWFRDFLFNPADLKPGTRMPTFFPNGKSANPTVLDGNVDRQMAAIWTYLKEIEKHPLPDKIIQSRSQDFELVPKDRPLLLRTFMQQAGTQAIAIGFPQRVHVAFDAETVRLVQAWRGRFLDAHGTWFDRFAPPAAPLGKDLMDFPPGAPLALLTDPKQPWPTDSETAGYKFLGYRLDQQGIPTLLYRFDRFEIADRIEPAPHRGLSRRLVITRLESSREDGADLFFRALASKKLQSNHGRSFTGENGLTATVKSPAGDRGASRQTDAMVEWMLRISLDNEAIVEVEYTW